MKILASLKKSFRHSSLVIFSLAASEQVQSQTQLHFDTFESGLGSWTNVTSGDNKNWLRDSGGTPSSSTGPSTGANGSVYYMYLETSSGSAYNAGDSAILLGPTINATGIQLNFDYHMHGNNMGTLAVDVLSNGTWIQDVWSISGQQHVSTTSNYTSANIDLSSYAVSQIRFRATAVGGYRGDMAIDNVEIESSPVGPVAPTFVSDPISKASARQENEYYASIATDAIDGNGDALTFSKVSGPTWLNVANNGILTGLPTAADVGNNEFVVEVSDGEFTDSANLTIEVIDNSTPYIVNVNDFELGFGDWSNVSVGDNKNWLRRSGSTPSSGTGPNGGHLSNYYLYLETSSGSAYTAGDSAIFLSPEFFDDNIHLLFNYHMYGGNIGSLSVDVREGDTWINDIWNVSGQQQSTYSDPYIEVDVDLSQYSASQVRFRAVAAGGYTGDIAIDSIQIESHPPLGPVAPEFLSDPIVKLDAVSEQAYSASLVDDARDANNDILTFSKISGPSWLVVTSAGSLGGTPSSSDIGQNNFTVQVSDGTFSTTANLDIEVLDGTVLPTISLSDFETGYGDWINLASGDDNNWLRDNAGTPSSGTGPLTGANGSQFYLYTETSSGAAYNFGDTTTLESQTINNASGIHLKLDYHMYGGDTGTLAVDVFDGVSWISDVWSLSGQQHSINGDAYTNVDIDLSGYTLEKIRLRATAAGGYRGDIAVDNLEILGHGSIGSGQPSQAKIVFVSSNAYNGDFGGLSGADAICQNDALNAGLPGTFKAFLSDNTTSAASRLTHSSIPYELVDGTQIAADWNDLVDGRIDNGLNLTASGTVVSGYVWTGSDFDGTRATYYPSDYPSGYQLDLTCNNWTMDTAAFRYLGRTGNTNDTGSGWADWWQSDGSPCSTKLGLYCIQQ